MSKKMKRSPFLVGSSGSGIPSPGTILKYLGLREKRSVEVSERESAQGVHTALTPRTTGMGCVAFPREQSRLWGRSQTFPVRDLSWKNTWGPLLYILMRSFENGGKRVTDTGVLRPLRGLHTY